MAWFDGTFDYSEEELKAEFPVVVTKNLRQSEDGKQIAIINDFLKGTEEYCLADPKAEEGPRSEYVFFHAFVGKDAVAAKRTIETFLANKAEKDSESITLFRQESERLFPYTNGHICKGKMANQSELRSLFRELPPEEVFILPLKRYLHQCPVCRQRTLLYRGFCEICEECGWEDAGIDDENERPWLAHHDQFTVKEYREIYLKHKAEDHSYKWFRGGGDLL